MWFRTITGGPAAVRTFAAPLMAASLAAGQASYYALERPLLRLKDRLDSQYGSPPIDSAVSTEPQQAA